MQSPEIIHGDPLCSDLMVSSHFFFRVIKSIDIWQMIFNVIPFCNVEKNILSFSAPGVPFGFDYFIGDCRICQCSFAAPLQFGISPVKTCISPGLGFLLRKVPSSMSQCSGSELPMCEATGFVSGRLFYRFISLFLLRRLQYFFMEKTNFMNSKCLSGEKKQFIYFG